ncbi:hypothetical protein JCM18694_03670 [Prolixibacter denitrificans]|nr:hypothetical protein JCM18694_03670 [Prolixibacter denitrificans]
MSIDEPQKVDLVFQANLTKPVLKSANLPYDEMLAELDCDWADYGTVHVRIATSDQLPDGGTDYYLGYTQVGEGIASDLVQLTPGTYFLTRFEIVEKIDEQVDWSEVNSKILLATPMDNSAFQDFVTDVLPFEFEVGEYQKNRLVFDVLCFNQQIAPAFGFEWFDYNIVEGDEICIFINCINEYDREFYHQVFASDIYAWKTAVEGETVIPAGDAPYWVVGPNYELTTPEGGDGSQIIGAVTPMCFPLYDVLEDMENGLILQLNPVFGKTAGGELIFGDSVMVRISLNIIMEYLGLIEYAGVPEDLGNGITVKVELTDDPQAENPRYIHIMLSDCHKPAYFESHNDGQVAEIYALRFDGEDVLMTKILDFTQMGRDPHIAVAPNRRQLYVVDSDVSNTILVYDLYSMSYQTFGIGGSVPEKVTQLVYMNDTLFAADMNTDALTFYVLDPDGLSYSEYNEITLDPTVDFSGGDLIAVKDDVGHSTLWSFSKNGGTSYVHEIDLATGDVTELQNEAKLVNTFGAMVYEGGDRIITGHGNDVGLKGWDTPFDFAGSFTTYNPIPDFTYVYGDLASPFILNRARPN